MDASNSITAAVFSAFIKCPTKAHLLAIGASPPGTFFADVEARISSMYKAVAKRRLHVGAEEAEPLEFGQLWRSSDYETITRDVDCETAVYDFALPPHRPGSRQPQKSKLSRTFVPVLLLPRDKLDVSDSLIVCFGALALSQVTGILADTGTLIYGEGHRRKTLKDREPRGPDSPDHRSDQGDLPRSGAASAHSEQALRRLRLPAEVSRPRGRT